MPWSGGVFTRTNGVYSGATVWASDKAASVNIVATRQDTHDQDLAQGINTALCKDGGNSPTADINWGGFKLTGLAVATNPSDAVRYDQLPGLGSYQPLDAGLTSISGLATAADRGLYTTALDVYAVYTLTAGGRALAGVAGTVSTFPYFSSTNTVTLASITTAGLALLDDASASAQRTTLGLGTIATQAASAVAITGGTVTGITDLAIADGGTGASTAAAAATALGVGSASAAAFQSVTLDSGKKLRKITLSTLAPSGGNDGDLWLRY